MSDKTNKIQIDIWNKYKNETKESLLEIISNQNKEIERLNEEVEKYKKRCYEALKLIRENYGLLDKYGIDMLDDILNGKW